MMRKSVSNLDQFKTSDQELNTKHTAVCYMAVLLKFGFTCHVQNKSTHGWILRYNITVVKYRLCSVTYTKSV